MVFYTMQGEAGENQRHPNAFMMNQTRKRVQQRDVVRAFPLNRAGAGKYLIRFRRSAGNKSFVFDDVQGNGSAEAPIHNGVIFLKVLRLDTVTYDLDFTERGAEMMSEAEDEESIRSFDNDNLYADDSDNFNSDSGSEDDDADDDLNLYEEENELKHQPSLATFLSSPATAHRNVPKNRKKTGDRNKGRHATMNLNVNVDDNDDDDDGGDLVQFSPRAGGSGGGNGWGKKKQKEKVKRTFEEEMADIGRTTDVESNIANRLEEIRAEDEASERMNEAKQVVEQNIHGPMDNWAKDGSSSGSFKQIRVLLATMPEVLWEGAKWKEVGMTDLIQPRKVKIAYFKAMRIVHPDKLPDNADTRTKVIAERIFEALNQSWKEFEAKEM
eukprot:g464.t1